MNRCANSWATCVFPTPPRPCSATGRTTAVLPPISCSCSFSRVWVRPGEEAGLVGGPHTRGGRPPADQLLGQLLEDLVAAGEGRVPCRDAPHRRDRPRVPRIGAGELVGH